MAIESVSSASVSAATNTPPQRQPAAEDRNAVQAPPPERQREPERTQTTQAVQQAAEPEAQRPTVNSTGQTVGRIVNTTA